MYSLRFFFNHSATTQIYTLSLHDALPISFGKQGETIVAGLLFPLLGRLVQDLIVREGMRVGPGHVRVHQGGRSEEHTSELQSLTNLVCRLLLEKKKKNKTRLYTLQIYTRR